MTDTADFVPDDFSHENPQPAGWLSPEEIAVARAQLPLVYVDAVPVRVDDSGDVVAVGLLLRVTPEGMMTRALVSGRVMFHERIRDALLRHIEKDLGPVALPRSPRRRSRSRSPSTSRRRASPPTTTPASTRCRSRTWCR